MWPGSWWMLYERFIRRAASMGIASREVDPSRYERNHLFCDVLVVGAGPAGLSAARAVGRAGAQVLLMESEPLLGGALWRDNETIDDTNADTWLQRAAAELRSLPNVRILLSLTGVDIVPLNGGTRKSRGKRRHIECDLLAVSGGFSPTVHLHSQSGGKVVFNEQASAFVPGPCKQAACSAGAAAGPMTLSACLSSGNAAGRAAVTDLGFHAASAENSAVSGPQSDAVTPLWIVPGTRRKALLDLQADVTSADVELAHREGYVSVEHLKRYTTLGMGTDQGKTSNLNGLAIMAALREQSIAQTGTTTFRPPYVPVAMGVFAACERGLHYQPIRRTAMHDWPPERRGRRSPHRRSCLLR